MVGRVSFVACRLLVCVLLAPTRLPGKRPGAVPHRGRKLFLLAPLQPIARGAGGNLITQSANRRRHQMCRSSFAFSFFLSLSLFLRSRLSHRLGTNPGFNDAPILTMYCTTRLQVFQATGFRHLALDLLLRHTCEQLTDLHQNHPQHVLALSIAAIRPVSVILGMFYNDSVFFVQSIEKKETPLSIGYSNVN